MSMTPEQAAEGWRAARISEVQNLMRIHGLSIEDIRDTDKLVAMVNQPTTAILPDDRYKVAGE